MNTAFHRSSASHSDPLAVNSTTMHQYYNTVQSDVNAEHAVDLAMSRRRAMALEAHRRRGHSGWLRMVAVALLLVSGVWLLS